MGTERCERRERDHLELGRERNEQSLLHVTQASERH